MTTVWRKDPCYFEKGVEKTVGHRFGPRSATTLRMQPNYVEWSWWQHSASPCLEIPEVLIKIFHWAVAALQCVTRLRTKLQLGVSIPSFMTERWLIPADTTDWWQCVGSNLAKVGTPALLWWSWDVNSNRKPLPMLLSTWIEFKILAIGVPKIYWHVSSQVAQPLTNWLELTWRGLSLWAVGKGSPFPPHTWTSARMLQDVCLPHLQLKIHPAVVWPNSLGQLVCWNVKTAFGIRLMVLQLTCHSLAKSWHQPWWNSSLEAAVCSSATAPSSARNRKSGQSTSSSRLPFRGKPFLSVSHTHYFRYGNWNNTFWRN